MGFILLQKDRERLRELARKQLEIANSPKNKERVALWKRHNTLVGERPVIHIEIDTFWQEVLPPLMQCEGEEARILERALLSQFSNMELFDDDKVVPDFFPVQPVNYVTLFGHAVATTSAVGSDGSSLGHHFEHFITDLEDDFEKLMQPSRYIVDKETPRKKLQVAEEIFGDILPVRMGAACLSAVPTQNVVHWMGMETMFCSMYDYPDEFKRMMDKIADDYIEFYRTLEREDVLLPTTGFAKLDQGSLCFTDELKDQGVLTSHDLWGHMDSQESVGLSPAMFEEFIFPCYRRIADEFGLLSYGCCEPVSASWEYIKTLPNLRKVSISPWCDETFMAEQLRGSRTIFHRKPSPNYLGVGELLDEGAFREHIDTTVKTAKGCKLEISQRDVYTINHDVGKVRRYVEIMRESIENHW